MRFGPVDNVVRSQGWRRGQNFCPHTTQNAALDPRACPHLTQNPEALSPPGAEVAAAPGVAADGGVAPEGGGLGAAGARG
ncbi:MAG: hypothetical protein ACREDK_09225, partial [Thermoplasmata archaeon]